MTKKRFSLNYKLWWWNMNNIIINYHHCGEENVFYLNHMNNKCRLDRQCVYPSVWRWK